LALQNLLSAIEALHTEVKGLREELRSERDAREALTRLRRAAADRKAKQRKTSRDSHGTPAPEPSVANSPGTVTGQESRDNHGTREVVKEAGDLDKLQTEKTLPDPGTITGQNESHGTRPEGRTVPTREAYVAAYRKRWGVAPLINKSANGQLARFVDLVGADAAPKVAAFFLTHEQPLYVNAKHPIPLLLRDASKLHTEWATNKPDVGGGWRGGVRAPGASIHISEKSKQEAETPGRKTL
jgi:hypothetical protein